MTPPLHAKQKNFADSALDAIISRFAAADKPTPTATATVMEVLEEIKSDRHRNEISRLRALLANGEVERYKTEKKGLPGVTFGGTFERRGNATLAAATGILVADLDHLPPPHIPALEATLRDDPHILFLFRSPSGEGLKAGLWAPGLQNDADHKRLFRAAQAYFKGTYGVDIDTACKDIARLTFVSWDGGAYANPEALPLPLDFKERTQDPPPHTGDNTHGFTGKALYAWRVVERCAQELREAEDGTKHATRVRYARLAGGYAHHLADPDRALQEVLRAGLANTSNVLQAEKTIKAMFEIGRAAPIEISDPPQDTPRDEPWPLPIPFDAIETPPITSDMIPSPLREFCEGVAACVQVPFELPVMGSLGAIATAAQGKFLVEVRPGYSEPLNIYSATVLPPGERKSASLEYCRRPLVEWEEYQWDTMGPEIKRVQSEHDTIKKSIEKARAKVPTDPKQLRETINLVQELEAQLPTVPVAGRLLCDDITPEALAAFMATYDERAAVLEAEGGLFSILAGMYSNGTPNLNLVLKSWGGESTSVDRRTKESFRLRAPALTLAFTPQPSVLRDIAGMPGFRERGLLGRFLFCLPKSRLGSRLIEPPPLAESIKSEYAATLNRILRIKRKTDQQGNPAPYKLTLSRAAYGLWLKFARSVEEELREGGTFESLRDWAGKLPGQAIRIAGLFHVATVLDPERASTIPEETMSMALDLAAALAEHACGAFCFMGCDPETECARKILKWLQAEEKKRFTARDAFEKVKGTYPKMEQVLPGLRVLEERWYIRRVESENRPGRGRKPSPLFDVNPLSHNSHNSQKGGAE